MTCDRRDYTDAFQCVVWRFHRRYRNNLTLYVAHNYLPLGFHSYYQRRTVLAKKRTVPYRYSKDHSFYRTVPHKNVAYRTVPLPPGVCGIPSHEIPYRQPVQFSLEVLV